MNKRLKKILMKCLKVLFVWCICVPLSIILLLVISFLIYKYIIPPPEYEEYIPQMGIHLKLSKLRDGNRARLYISDDKDYTDYVEFKYFPSSAPEIYYHPVNGLYVIDDHSIYQIKVSRHRQSIKYINRKMYGESRAKGKFFLSNTRLDSIQTARINQILGHPIFKIGFYGSSDGFYIMDDNNKAIYSTVDGFYN